MGAPITYVNGTRIYRWYYNKKDLNRAYMNKKLVFAKSLYIRVTNGFSTATNACGKYISVKALIAQYRKYNEQEITIEVVSNATVPRMIFDQAISAGGISSIKLINNGFIRASCESGYGMYVYPNCNITLHNNGEISGGGGRGGQGGQGGASGTKKWTTTSWSKHWSDAGRNGYTWQHNVHGPGSSNCCTNSILWWNYKRLWAVGAGSPKVGPVTVGGVKYKRGSGGYFQGCWNYPVMREDKKSHSISGKPGGAGGAGGKGFYYGAPDKRKGAPGANGTRNSGGYISGKGGQGGWGGTWGVAGKGGYTGQKGEHGSNGAGGKSGNSAGYSIQGKNQCHITKTGKLHGPTANT